MKSAEMFCPAAATTSCMERSAVGGEQEAEAVICSVTFQRKSAWSSSCRLLREAPSSG